MASTWPALTACPRCTGTRPTRPELAKFRLVTPLLLTEPVKDRLSDRAIRGTYQSAAATTDGGDQDAAHDLRSGHGPPVGACLPRPRPAWLAPPRTGYFRPAPQPPPAPAPGLRSAGPLVGSPGPRGRASCASRTSLCPSSPSGPWSSASESVPPTGRRPHQRGEIQRPGRPTTHRHASAITAAGIGRRAFSTKRLAIRACCLAVVPQPGTPPIPANALPFSAFRGAYRTHVI